MKQTAIAAVLSLAAYPAAGELVLDLPIDCTPGESCYVQHFVDRDPSADVQDFTCGTLSYDGHKGTDFALPTLQDMDRGVDVLAAAPGIVAGLRDGMADRIYQPGDVEVDNRECGNGTVIRHEDGWETQYCHLKSGSLRVAQGQRVESGTVLGQVGLSGQTQFPHLHLSVRHNGTVVDPYQPDMSVACDTPTSDLWADTPEYTPGGVIYAGFFPGLPEYDAIKQGSAAQTTLEPDAPGLVLFAFAYGGQKGDVLTLEIEGPDGAFLNKAITLEKPQAQFFRAAGKRRTQGPWAEGTYSGTAILTRKGAEVSRQSTRMTIN
ncbi:M23 family metallopeptidase [Phaeobacter marinintestinus]|uniref:M23 family metallopeptidase n=1 Tax=Falsiphaeobacter marinintestinus TaxID=1492905 RepID=UPI0011B7ECAE|nr:M23 family metallopeptidase [Phaeobacter marinintestinus]